jgi:hypothetical protein
MTWNNEPIDRPPSRVASQSLPLRVVHIATYLVFLAIFGWTAFFAVHFSSELPPGCTRAEFLGMVWLQFLPGYTWLLGMLFACYAISFALRRTR